jgi:hypothetical protein
MTEPNATPADLAAIRRAAADRIGYLKWLADKLVHPIAGLDITIRKEAAHELRAMAEGERQ